MYYLSSFKLVILSSLGDKIGKVRKDTTVQLLDDWENRVVGKLLFGKFLSIVSYFMSELKEKLLHHIYYDDK